MALCVSLGLSGVRAETVEVDLRLRIAWGGGAERLWQGKIALSEGTLADPVPLGIEADEAGSMWLESDTPPALPVRDKPRASASSGAAGYLVVRQRSPRTYDAVDLVVRAPAEASLRIALCAMDETKDPQWIDVRLADVLRGAYAADLDDRGNRLVVHRRPGDDLRVRVPRRALIYRPDEAFQCEVLPHLASVESGAKVRLKLQLVAARTSQEIWADERSAVAGDPAPVAVEVPLSKCAEGVYDLVIAATHAGRLPWAQQIRPSLGLRPPVAERTVQFVVLDPRARPAPLGEGRLSTVVEIDPANPKWWDRFAKLPALPRVPRLWKGPLGNGNLRVVQHALGEAAELAPSKAGDPSWEAYTLPIHRPGEPHVLEIDYPSDAVQTLGVSIVEPNAAGAVVPIGLDSGIDQPETVVGPPAPPRWLQHRVIFWPRTKTPVVLMTNRRDRAPAVYGKIRVQAGWGRLPRAFPPGPSPERLLAGYLDRPLFPENFCATESLGSLSELSVDDWLTFYEGATRLVDYLHHVGYNGLMLSVAADGSTIYPSDVFAPTPRYDTGALFATGQDPVRKDVLELLLRLFDREGLQVVPAIEFASPLPELEAAVRRGGPEAEGLRWIGPAGLDWAQVHAPLRGKAPYYNVLHPRVQEAMLAAVREVAAGYGRHAAMAGMAIQLSAYGYAQLPGPEWGLDDATIARFEQDLKIRLPTAEGPTRYARRMEALLHVRPDGGREWRREWLEWRAAQMSRFYRRVFDEINAVRPGGRLYLAGGDMFAGPEWERELLPSLPRKTSLADAMLRAGIDPRMFGEDRGIVLLRSDRIVPHSSLARRAASLEIDQMPDVDRYFQPLWPTGALFFHPPQDLRVASFDEKSPFRPCYTWLAAQVVASDAQNRRRFIHSLATLDAQAMFDGGWTLPMGQEDALRDLAAVYRQLPAVRFESAVAAGGPGGQPATVRYATRGDRTYAYVVNDAPFPVTVRVRVDMPAGCRIEPLATARSVGPLRRDAEGTHWEADLGPYDLVGAWFSAPGVRLSDPQTSFGREIQLALEKRLRDLGDRAAAIRVPPLFEALQNPGFDLPAPQPGQIPGWTATAPPGVTVGLDNNAPLNGTQSARIASQGPTGGLASHCFAAPGTGRLSLSVWLRVADAAQQPPVRLTVAGKLGARDFVRSAHVGQPLGNAGALPIKTEWSLFVVHVTDLPLEGLSELHLRFELTGPGEVWIDDVQLSDLAFRREEGNALMRLLAPATAMLDSGRVGDCLRLLDGYWPRFLAEHVALAATPVAQKPDPTAPASKEPARSARLIDRVRNLVPERLR